MHCLRKPGVLEAVRLGKQTPTNRQTNKDISLIWLFKNNIKISICFDCLNCIMDFFVNNLKDEYFPSYFFCLLFLLFLKLRFSKRLIEASVVLRGGGWAGCTFRREGVHLTPGTQSPLLPVWIQYKKCWKNDKKIIN